jgi:reversibly glycosylated polypeptide/UDP-arabinopyranose mutase
MVGEGIPNIVVPTIRSPEFFSGFLDDWNEEFQGCHLIIIEDRAEKELVSLMESKTGYTYEIYDHTDIDMDLKEDSWIIPRKTDCVRNYGYYKAYKNKALFIVTLDDDTKPLNKGHIQQFYNNLFTPVTQEGYYFSTMNCILPRGKLLSEPRECVISHGCWVNVPDLDAKTQIEFNGQLRVDESAFYKGFVPYEAFYSMCGMNLAWKTDFTKYMYFPIQGKHNGAPVDRCGDIWTGYYSKQKADEEDKAVYTGDPMVVHTRASNPWSNLKKEEGEDIFGQQFFSHMVYEEIKPTHGYWKKLKDAYKIWERLLDD